jgi:hypothetical protein
MYEATRSTLAMQPLVVFDCRTWRLASRGFEWRD